MTSVLPQEDNQEAKSPLSVSGSDYTGNQQTNALSKNGHSSMTTSTSTGSDKFQTNSSMSKEEVIKQLQDLIEDEFNLEIILKQRELYTIETELSKCEAYVIALRNHYSIKPSERLVSEPEDLTVKYAKLLTQLDDVKKEVDEYKRIEEQRRNIPSFANDFSFGSGNHGGMLHNGSIGSGFGPLSMSGEEYNSYGIQDSSYRTRSQTSSLRPAKYAQQCIYRRSDSVYVKIKCVNCGRSNFSSCQGFLNHARIAHGKEYTSQDNAALICGEVLPDEEQDYSGLESLKQMRIDGLDPNKILASNPLLGGKSAYTDSNGLISTKSSISALGESPAPTNGADTTGNSNTNSTSNTNGLPTPQGTTPTPGGTTITENGKTTSNSATTTATAAASANKTVYKTDHLKAKILAMKSESGNNDETTDDFQNLVTDVTTKVDKPHLFEGEEETPDLLLSELASSINKRESLAKTGNGSRSAASSRGLSTAASSIPIVEEDNNDSAAGSAVSAADKESEEFRERVKKTQNILLEAKKMNLNVDEYLRVALKKRQSSGEAIDDNGPAPHEPSNKKQKFGGNRRKKSRGFVAGGVRHVSNPLPATSAPTTRKAAEREKNCSNKNELVEGAELS